MTNPNFWPNCQWLSCIVVNVSTPFWQGGIIKMSSPVLLHRFWSFCFNSFYLNVHHESHNDASAILTQSSMLKYGRTQTDGETYFDKTPLLTQTKRDVFSACTPPFSKSSHVNDLLILPWKQCTCKDIFFNVYLLTRFLFFTERKVVSLNTAYKLCMEFLDVH